MSSDSGRLIAVGDVHGCAHALDALLDAIEPNGGDQIVFLGDLIDQGRDSRDVLDRLIALESQCQVVLIRGNHEEMLYAARDSVRALRYWETCGGVATLNSYHYGARVEDIPVEHWALLDQGRPYYETKKFIFLHANYVPDLPLHLQPEHQLRWALLEPSEARAHYSGKTVVVGHTEQPDSEILDLGFVICIDTACWRHGWLTALEVNTRQVWQASRWGMLRDQDERPHRGDLPQLVPPSGV